MSSKNEKMEDPDPLQILQIFAKTAAKSLIFTIIWIPVYLFRCTLVYLLTRFLPNYGKILDHNDLTKEEKYWKEPPKTSLIFTCVLDAPLNLDELRQLFIQNVLEAKIKNKWGNEEIRYREFKQYQSDFLGYRFWKDDPSFNINNHIIELPYCQKFSNMSKLHTELSSKLYHRKRSPWDIILVNNYLNEVNKALLIFRNHHTLGDSRSIMKVLVECLGQKPPTTPKIQYKESGIIDKAMYYVLMPFFFVYSQVYTQYIQIKADNCPLKYKNEDETFLNVGISNPVSMNEAKLIAKRNNVTTSAVIMAIMAGAVAKIDDRLSRKGTPCKWMLPKPDHPPKLANHVYAGVTILPTDHNLPLERLERCQEIFMQLKSTNLYVYDRSVLFQTGTWFNPLREKWMKHTTFPLILTNNAGEGQGFSIGTSPVSELNMTCAPHAGACGVIICSFSYKNTIHFSATAKNTVLNDSQTQQLANLMAEEIEILKSVSK